MSENLNRPSIYIDPDLSEDRQITLRGIDRLIHNRPRVFAEVIDTILSDKNDLEIDSLSPDEAKNEKPAPEAVGRHAMPKAVVLEVLRLRLDSRYEYDDHTEKEILQDPFQQELLHMPKEALVYRRGKMSSETRNNPNAAFIRDRMRLNRIRIYAARVALFNDAKRIHRHPAADEQLQSTG